MNVVTIYTLRILGRIYNKKENLICIEKRLLAEFCNRIEILTHQKAATTKTENPKITRNLITIFSC